MKTIVCVGLGFFLLTMSGIACAQVPSTDEASQQVGAIPISQLISVVARKSGKKFLVDPRVRAEVTLMGERGSDLTYSEFLTILQVYGFAAIPDANYVRVVPDAIVRQMSIPLLSDRDKHADAEYVSQIIRVKTMQAAMLVPVLRPLMPQQAHLAAVTCSNALILVDTFANVRRIEALIQSVDTGEPYKAQKCEMRELAASRESATPLRDTPIKRGD